jgi:hypothetical protein
VLDDLRPDADVINLGVSGFCENDRCAKQKTGSGVHRDNLLADFGA